MKVQGKLEVDVDLMDVARALSKSPESFAAFWRTFAEEVKGGRKSREDPLGQRDMGVDLDPFIMAMSRNLNAPELGPLMKIVDGVRYLRDRPSQDDSLLCGGTLPFRIGDAGQ